jgi:hypothetical protein
MKSTNKTQTNCYDKFVELNQTFSDRMDVSLCRRLRRLATLDRRCRLSRRSLSHRFPTTGSGLSNR